MSNTSPYVRKEKNAVKSQKVLYQKSQKQLRSRARCQSHTIGYMKPRYKELKVLIKLRFIMQKPDTSKEIFAVVPRTSL